MGLKIYNSLTNKVEPFEPLRPGIVNMYVCGPTVYNHIHLGNARPVVFYDMLKNYLEFLGYKVHYASNITDVDDKIINQAIEEHKTEKEIADYYEKAYFEAVQKVGSNKPDQVPHATEYIEDMIQFITKLIQLGYAYEVDGDVFFRVSKVADYGCLSNQVGKDLEQGARISINEKKENPLDFALWKKTEVGIKWNSPFGSGRPGWHTECVVMNHKLFNGEIDIHGGGMDLKFPHHENEIAQSEAMYHHHLAKYWMHVGRLEFNGEKMSKSLHNVIYVKDLENDRVGMILRMILVFTPYRNNFSYSDEVYHQYEKVYDKWQRSYKQGLYEMQIQGIVPKHARKQAIESFKEYMNQDLNVQNVMTLIEQLMKDLNMAVRNHDWLCVEENWCSIDTILKVLGIQLFVNPMSKEDMNVYRLWLQARLDKNFEKADQYRMELVQRGIL